MKEKMKFIAVIALTIISAVQLDKVCADTQIDNNNGSANTYINVTAPTTDNLYLTLAPDFNFSNTESSTRGPITVAGTEPYNIVNITGTTRGYNLQQKISNFTAMINGTPTVLPLKYFKISVADNATGTIKGNSGVNVLGQAGRVLTGQPNAQGNQRSGNATAEIELDTTQVIKPGAYQATITNTLVQGL
ncbi:hypothetical protein [Lactococcus garvieae]|jgi:hypothetical protein|uniref:hypothetical protein n=1 Tax=Lactococcus garvieae TaxID=1363 RepID=UPI0009BDEAA1|nr:hypothetical protein [Lactococcus garvieae]